MTVYDEARQSPQRQGNRAEAAEGVLEQYVEVGEVRLTQYLRMNGVPQ